MTKSYAGKVGTKPKVDRVSQVWDTDLNEIGADIESLDLNVPDSNIADNAIVVGDGGAKKTKAASGVIIDSNNNITAEGNYVGLLQNTVENTSSASANVAGATHKVVNDSGYWALNGITNSGSTILGGSLINTFHHYSQGYADNLYTVDGNKDHVFYTDPTDSHDFSALSNEVMRIKADGSLILSGYLSSSSVSITDPNNHYTGTEVNTALQEIGNVRNSGIQDPSKLSISYSAATRQFTIVNTGTDICVNGVASTPENETTTAHADTTYQYWVVYASGATTATVTTTPSIGSQVVADRILYNTDQGTPKAIEFEERHSQQWSSKLHENMHETIGAKLVTTPLGCTMTDFTLKSDDDDDMKFSLSAGEMYDEDIEHIVTALASGTYTIAYRAGADSAQRLDWLDSESLPYLSGGSYIYWNQNNAGTWQLTEMTTNDRVCYYAFAWTRKDNTRDVVIFIGQQSHENDELALAETLGDLDLPSYLAPEQVPLYKIVFRTRNTYSSTGQCRIEAITDYRGEVSGAQVISGSVVDHQSLSNRDLDGHPNNPYSLGREGGQKITGSTLTGEDLTLEDNSVENNTVTVKELVQNKDILDTLIISRGFSSLDSEYIRDTTDSWSNRESWSSQDLSNYNLTGVKIWISCPYTTPYSYVRLENYNNGDIYFDGTFQVTTANTTQEFTLSSDESLPTSGQVLLGLSTNLTTSYTFNYHSIELTYTKRT